jgi:hypothetical protein
MSTVGTASATDSFGNRTLGELALGGGGGSGSGRGDGDRDMMMGGSGDGDEDMLSMDTNYRETEMDSASGYLGTGGPLGDLDAMDEDLASRSVGGFEDRMSDDGTASLVGFGEGAGSTVSGPIYHRRPLPGQVGGGGGPSSSASAMGNVWTLERSSSGLSDGAFAPGVRRDRDLLRERGDGGGGGGIGGGGGDTPMSITAVMERREARMMDGVATDGAGVSAAGSGGSGTNAAAGVAGEDDMFVDTTTRGPVPVQPNTSAIRETQQPHSFQQQQQQGAQQAAASREAVERMLREKREQQQQQQQYQQSQGNGTLDGVEKMIEDRLDEGEADVGSTALGSPGRGGDRLGKFYFEERK